MIEYKPLGMAATVLKGGERNEGGTGNITTMQPDRSIGRLARPLLYGRGTREQEG